MIFFFTRIFVLLAIGGLIYWGWGSITSWISNTTTNFFRLFGFGIALVDLESLLEELLP